MRLTDNEIRDINRYLEAGKPLPDEYRFLLFADKREVELVWNGKTGDVCNTVLPFQTIEQVDEPRTEDQRKLQFGLFDSQSGRQSHGWHNKLIWGDNRLILSSLKNGPMRDEIEQQGGLKLVYIDPPFDVGANFSMNIDVGGDNLTKAPGVLEEIAYRDTWGKGADSYISMIYERLVLIRELLSDEGSIYVHCDWRVSGYIRLIMDEVFGRNNFINEIIWCYKGPGKTTNSYKKKHDTIFAYSKQGKHTFNPQRVPLSASTLKVWGKYFDDNGQITYGNMRVNAPGMYKRLARFGSPNDDDVFLDKAHGSPALDWWEDLPFLNKGAEVTGYPTQKPEDLIERIIATGTNPGDLVGDFFVGSGTTAAVAEKLGRKWICSDIGKFAVHTTRKRMISIQRSLKKEDKTYRAFQLLNLGKYERHLFVGGNLSLSDDDNIRLMREKEEAFCELIIKAYAGEPLRNNPVFHGRKSGRYIAIGPVNLPVARLMVENIIDQCTADRITKVDILGFEFEMGLFPHMLDEAKAKGIDLALKYIPPDVFDKRAVENGDISFYDVAFIEVKPHIHANQLSMELTDYSVFYSQDASHVEASLKNGRAKVIVDSGQVVKVSKDRQGIVTRNVLTKSWTDWIDYWSVDFDFESRKEITRTLDPETGELTDLWTGDYIFENEWQSFRTKKNRDLTLQSAFIECNPGRRKVAVKVVDIFGNDTMKVVEITIGGSK